MLQVTCAIIEHADKILICQRSTSMKLPLKWEFPGGKIEPGESKEDCWILRFDLCRSFRSDGASYYGSNDATLVV
ncbi:NUDIX domain-containing protein [Sphingobacterium multivorum]|uniref:NUDIX domain-containing protein n=1 Tax=Sphingobacterium multivorum TaxID=28454 RepID=UPI00301AF004